MPDRFESICNPQEEPPVFVSFRTMGSIRPPCRIFVFEERKFGFETTKSNLFKGFHSFFKYSLKASKNITCIYKVLSIFDMTFSALSISKHVISVALAHHTN